MPFSWFGGNTTSSTANAETSGRRHARKVSLSNSSGGGLGNSSGGKSSRLAGVRAETRASYLRKDLNLSGDLSTSRSRRGRTNTRSQAIVAVEPDSDFSEHRRIDQGLIDASMEAQNKSVLQPPLSSAGSVQNNVQNNKSWWGGFSTATAAPPPASTPLPTSQIPSNNNNNNIRLGISHSAHVPKSSSSSMSKSNLQHRRTVSNKFRVP